MSNETLASSERMMVPEVVITGEAVALEVRAASAGLRILSGLIDYSLYAGGLVMSLLSWSEVSLSTSTPSSEAIVIVLLSLTLLFWMLLLPLTIEVLSRGQSAGRLITGTRVVRDDGGTVRLRHCLVRTLLAVVEIWTTWAVPALCASIVSKRGKRFGDMLAGTYVVREHHRSHMAPPLLMPPELAQWAAGTDLRALPGDLSLTARTFLQRASSLMPASRHQLGLELASQVQEYVSPPPPAGTHPERFLAAVLTERRNRELVLESRDRRLEEDVLRDMARPPYEVGPEARRR